MSPDKTVADILVTLVAAHARGQAGVDWRHDVAVRFGALGVYGDLGGGLMVRPDGTVLSWGWDDERVSVVTNG